MAEYMFSLVSDLGSEDNAHTVIQVIHPLYTTDARLADWIERLEVRRDPRYDVLRWLTPGSAALTQAHDLVINFKADGTVEVSFGEWFTRTVFFLNARNDDERMQQLLDILINCWAEKGLAPLDLIDVCSIFQQSERGVIASVEDVGTLLDYCARWPKGVEPLLGTGKLTSLQCIYREYEPSMSSISCYSNGVKALLDGDGAYCVGVMGTEKRSDRQNAVLYFGMSER